MIHTCKNEHLLISGVYYGMSDTFEGEALVDLYGSMKCPSGFLLFEDKYATKCLKCKELFSGSVACDALGATECEPGHLLIN